jgi:hypothetical protein
MTSFQCSMVAFVSRADRVVGCTSLMSSHMQRYARVQQRTRAWECHRRLRHLAFRTLEDLSLSGMLAESDPTPVLAGRKGAGVPALSGGECCGAPPIFPGSLSATRFMK